MTGITIRDSHSDIKVNVGGGLLPAPGGLNFDNSLSVREARAFLAEMRRVVSPGGVVRIAAPDLSLLTREYGGS